MRYIITGRQAGAIGIMEHLANVEASSRAEAFERAEHLRPEFEHLQPVREHEPCPACGGGNHPSTQETKQ